MTPDIEALAARLDDVDARVGRMAIEGRGPRMSIPMRPDEDDDIVICATVRDAKDLIWSQAARIAELESERTDILNGAGAIVGSVTDTAAARDAGWRDVVLWMLWGHQGFNSGVGLPLRMLLGYGRSAPLSNDDINAARRAQARIDAARAKP